jgi:hypothetical protein
MANSPTSVQTTVRLAARVAPVVDFSSTAKANGCWNKAKMGEEKESILSSRKQMVVKSN